MNFENVREIIIKRQSLYTAQMLKGGRIEDDKIKRLLELANYAPSHRRTAPWHLVVFKEKTLFELYHTLSKIYIEITPNEEFKDSKVEKLKQKPLYLSHAVAICMKRDNKKSVPSFEEEYAVACAVQNILLGMSSLNIIGYWSSPILCYTHQFKEYLNLEDDDKCLGILQLGIKKQGLPQIPKIPYENLDDKIVWR